MEESLSNFRHLRQSKTNFAPQSVAGAPIEHSKLSRNNATHCCNGDKKVFGTSSPEKLALVIFARPEVAKHDIGSGTQKPSK